MFSRRNSARNSFALYKMISSSDKVVRWISSIPSFTRVFIKKLHHYHTTLFIGFASDTDDYTQIDLLLDTGASSELESRAGILATPSVTCETYETCETSETCIYVHELCKSKTPLCCRRRNDINSLTVRKQAQRVCNDEFC